MAKYKIVGKPLTHDEMIEIAKSKEPRLYCFIDNFTNTIIPVYVEGIKINLDTKQWEFVFDGEELFEEDELIFKTKRGARQYANRRNK